MKNFFHILNYALIYGKNYLLSSLAIYFPKITPPPSYIGLSVGTVCNFRCQQCDLWKVPTKPQEYLKTNQIKKILDDLGDWLGPFRLTFTGAEPFLRKDILEIIKFASEKGIYIILTTNAWLIGRNLAKEIIDSGLDLVNISLDGAQATTHDSLRRKGGSFKKIMAALENLKKARGQGKLPFIYFNTVIMKQNLGELVDLVKLTKKEKIEAIRFQALESKYLFGDKKYNSRWFKKDKLWPKDKKKLFLAIDNLISLKKKGYPIKNTIKELNDLKDYYQNPFEIAKKYKFCFTGVRNFSIDEYGKVKLCFGMKPVGDLLKQRPKDIWYSPEAENLRKVIRHCQRSCRILPCNKKEELGQLLKVFLRRVFS